MSPNFAALLCWSFIAWMVWREMREEDYGRFSWALLIPLAWMLIAASRFVSQWISPVPHVMGLEQAIRLEEGSPLDRVVFAGLMALGLLVLVKRRALALALISENRWIVVLVLFGLASVAWSDFSFVSLKRWIKWSGNVVMALVILTEKRPYEAALALLRRCTVFLVPLSVLTIKYFPEIGRVYNRWTYEPMFTGVAMTKNGLGQICIFAFLYLLWRFVGDKGASRPPRAMLDRTNDAILLMMVSWLLVVADSATSLTCVALIFGIFLVSRLPAIARSPTRLMTYGLVSFLGFGILFSATNFGTWVIVELLGRDPTLTTRVPMWLGLMEMAPNAFVGVGFESFWLGERLMTLQENFGRLNQAHNGYLETYLNLGIIGLSVLLICLVAGLRRARRHLATSNRFAVIRLIFLVVPIVYNWTEASFHGVNNIWLLMLIGIIGPIPAREIATPSLAPKRTQLRQSLTRADKRDDKEFMENKHGVESRFALSVSDKRPWVKLGVSVGLEGEIDFGAKGRTTDMYMHVKQAITWHPLFDRQMIRKSPTVDRQ